MKIAVISDIHSNIWALEAVLADAEKLGVDHIFNLGDNLYGPLDPRGCYELLQDDKIINIAGNQDRQICNARKDDITSNPTMAFIIEQIPSEALEWMNNLPSSAVFDDIYACHGAPTDDLTYMLEDVSSGQPHVKNDVDIKSLLTSVDQNIILCGHTHIPRIVELKSCKTIINPGSVGLPAYQDDAPNLHQMETFSPKASYCIIEIDDEQTSPKVSFIKLSYDHHKAAATAHLRNREDWATALETGRVKPVNHKN